MAESSLSEDGKYFSVLSQDGRLKIWDTETNVLKQEYTPDLHLSSPTSCLQWITLSNATEQRKKGRRKSSGSEHEIQCIALGTNSGKILIYNLANAKVDTILSDTKVNSAQSHRVTSLDWHRKCGLFSCSKDNFLCEWDIQNAVVKNKYDINVDSKNKHVNSINAIKIINHNQDTPAKFVVTASWQIRVWRLVGAAATVVRDLGHSGAPSAVLDSASLKNKCYIIVGSHNERLLSFWDVTVTPDMIPDTAQNDEDFTPTKKQRKKSLSEVPGTVAGPTYNFVLEDAPRNVDVVVRETPDGVKIDVAASTRSGVLHYYGHMMNGSITKPIKPSVTLHVTTEAARPMSLQCCKFTKFTDEENSGEMTIGYEATPGRLLFERIVPDKASKTQVLIRSDPSAEKSKRKSKADDTNKVRSSNASEQAVTYVEPTGGATRKRAKPGAKIEVPMEARLANLALDVKGRRKSAVNQNLTKLLVQGLHSKDKGIISMVLQKDDPQVAKRTVATLPADYLPPLLDRLTEMATKKTSQCAAVCTWLNALIHCHSALLLATLSTSATGEKFTQLLTILMQRRSHLSQLLNVRGRLRLTNTQREASQMEEDVAPVIDYADTSSDEEMDVEKASSSGQSLDDHNFEETDSEEAASGKEEVEDESDDE